ncbi:iron ABC transporter permease [Cetobacterium sp. 8H]|uniref:FecCD family ABC transporter permease n=1 Tax=Cetobacterium sp. 8H TaxID=2759681 RepID=UPI00163CA83D|nr:iron ABC transporter permease [Cetobacterium sp. 8H]
MKNNYKNIVILSIFLIFLISTIAITVGSVSLSPFHVWKILLNKLFHKEIFEIEWKKTTEMIVWNLRVPRILLALISGAGLSLVGILMQALTKNSLASPYILGISSGASTGAVISIVIGGIMGFNFSPGIGAFLFGTLTAFLVFYLSGKGSYSSSKLVLTGVAISSFFSGITTFLVTTAKSESQLRGAMFWISGSLAGARWGQIAPLFLTLLISTILTYIKYRELNILVAGDELAETLGVNVSRLRLFIVIISTLLTGFIVASTGVIGFVGLVVPHISRGLIGSNHKRLIPCCLLLGAVFLAGTDTLTRVIFKTQEIPIGVITSIMGAPFFMSMLRKNSYKFGG